MHLNWRGKRGKRATAASSLPSRNVYAKRRRFTLKCDDVIERDPLRLRQL